jgi:hypothetical protein
MITKNIQVADIVPGDMLAGAWLVIGVINTRLMVNIFMINYAIYGVISEGSYPHEVRLNVWKILKRFLGLRSQLKNAGVLMGLTAGADHAD